MNLNKELPDNLAGVISSLVNDAVQTSISAPAYMNASKAAQYLGVSRSTFYNWTKKHSIQTINIDGTKAYSRVALDNFMKAHEE